jgi:CDP-paratose 2-epimerase
MEILVTGGAGFVGSHIAEYYANKDNHITIFDNLCRNKLLKKNNKNIDFNKRYLKKYSNIEFLEGDISDFHSIFKIMKDKDIVLHTAAQTAVTTSVSDPYTDFRINALGTFNVLEAARRNDIKKLIYCSTNKVYGSSINNIKIIEKDKRYHLEERYIKGIPESYGIDLCEHTPYGCSKLSGDLYAQDYSYVYGIKTGIFRMSCIYGTRQFGVEDQGWIAWFTIATLMEKPITIYGNGKQVRDVLYVTDLVEAFDKFVNSNLNHGVFNIGGGYKNTLSLLELVDILEELTGKKSVIEFSDWRPSDQKVFISDISKAKEKLNWEPKIGPKVGIKKLVNWIEDNINLF